MFALAVATLFSLGTAASARDVAYPQAAPEFTLAVLGEDRRFTIQSAGPVALNQKYKAAQLGMVDSIMPLAEE